MIYLKLTILKLGFNGIYKETYKTYMPAGIFYMGLNDAFKNDHYPLPGMKEGFAKLNRSRIFSKIDLSDAYLKSEVDNECSKLR